MFLFRRNYRKTRSTFIDIGWDFVDEVANGTDFIWDIREGITYPRLGLFGEFVEPDGVDLDDPAGKGRIV